MICHLCGSGDLLNGRIVHGPGCLYDGRGEVPILNADDLAKAKKIIRWLRAELDLAYHGLSALPADHAAAIAAKAADAFLDDNLK